MTNGQFLYRIGYLICSMLGVIYSPFFYAFHLIDVVLSFPMLKAILQSVTHNLKQVRLLIEIIIFGLTQIYIIFGNYFSWITVLIIISVDIDNHDDIGRRLSIHGDCIQLFPQVLRSGRRRRRARSKVSQYADGNLAIFLLTIDIFFQTC